MSNIVTKKLSINKNNIEQYCDAQNVSFNVSDHAWRKWLNGSTDGYVILKSDGKAVLYPTDTARPFKADSLISASRSAGTCTVDLQFAGTNVHSESYTSGTQKEKSKTDITDSAVTNSTKATEIKWHVYGKNGDNQRGDLIELTLYFYQYAMSANIGAGIDSVKSVSVSTSAPYYGDSVTFSATLIKGAIWDGWYSDSACTTLVSADQSYTITADSDVTLYAKATTSATIYSCTAVAKDNIVSTTVSDDSVVSGESCTFSATASEHYEFSGWYSDESCTVLVSTENPYVATISSNTTLYAKATAIMYLASVGTPEHGTATVTPSSAPYGGTVTFSCEVTQTNRGFHGWYSDPEYKMLVSKDVTYSCMVTKDIILYPKTGYELHTKIIHPAKLFDPLPYRGLVNGATPSQSIPVDVTKIQNITLSQASTTVYAYQPHVTSAPHTYGMSMWFGDNPLPEMPDNATVVDIHAEFGYSLADAGYDSIKIGVGRFEYISDNDETPITDNASFAYVDETESDQEDEAQLSVEYLFGNRVSNYENPMVRSTDTKELAIQSGTSIITDTFSVPISDSTAYPVGVADLKNGKLGFQINCVSQSNSGSPRRFRLHAFDLYITYTIEDVSYSCDAISDGHVDVTIQSHDNAPGVECTWIALPEGGYRFDGWYSDANYTNLVSTELEYTQVITGPLTLYAKSKYHSRVVSRILEIPFGKGATYLTGKDTDNKVLDTQSGSGWVPDFELSDYGWLASIADVQDIKATAATCNKSNKPYVVKAVLNDAAKEILFPNSTAHLVRLDSHGCFGRAAIGARVVTNKITNPNTGADYITPTFGGISGSVWRPNMIHDVELNYENIREPQVLASNRNTEICYLLAQGVTSIYRAIGIDQIKLTGYFEEYDFVANTASGSKGIRSVTSSQSIGYEGDTVTFSVGVASYATFEGWYSDAAGTELVNTQKDYSVTPDANLTLYAKASAPEGNVYNCVAVAKDNIASVSVSEPDMIEGGTCTFTATLNPGAEFSGWYSDEACTQLVSNSASYIVVISSNTTLYAKAEKIVYSVSVGATEHCTASVSSATAYYGDSVTFSCTVDEGYEFKGWYSDEACTQLVSESASYVYSVSGDITLWAKVERIQYTITLTTPLQYNGSVHTIISCDLNSLTSSEYVALKRGELDSISQDKIFSKSSVTSTFNSTKTATIKCPAGYAVGMSATESNNTVTFSFSLNGEALTNWPYYMGIPTGNQDYQSVKNTGSCICSAIALDGISSAYVPSHVAQGKEAPFEAEVKSGYSFLGWYDEDGNLVSADNPASIETPANSGTLPDPTSLTLYAKATKVELPPTGIYLKPSGTWVEAKVVYKKVNGTWVQQDDPKTLFSGSSSGSESNYIYCGDVSS